MFVESSTQYTSFSSRKQPANSGSEHKQFAEKASVALQQPILTHAHSKCPPVRLKSIVFMGTAFRIATLLGLAKSAYELTYKKVPFLNGREDEIML